MDIDEFYHDGKKPYVKGDTLYINVPQEHLDLRMIHILESDLADAHDQGATKIQVSCRGNIYQSTFARIRNEGNNYGEHRTMPLHLWTKIVVEAIPQDPTQRLNNSLEKIRRKHGDNSIHIGTN